MVTRMILDEGIEAVKENRFKSWYVSLSKEDKKDFDKQMMEFLRRLNQIFRNKKETE